MTQGSIPTRPTPHYRRSGNWICSGCAPAAIDSATAVPKAVWREPGIVGGMDGLAISPQCAFASVIVGNEIDEDTQWRKRDLVARVADGLWDQSQ